MIHSKLLELQNRVGAISKDSKNPFLKSNYFDINKIIETLKPLLEELGLLIMQPIIFKDGKNILRTEVIFQSDSDVQLGIVHSEIALPDNLEPQKMGSAITYYRRYSLQSLLFLQAEDDDGTNTKAKTPTIDPKIALRKRLTELGATDDKKGAEVINGYLGTKFKDVNLLSDQQAKAALEKLTNDLPF